jgi:glycine dehydrogenase
LESLVNFQTMVSSLTSMEMANASLLDEATAAAEAMVMSYTAASQKKTFLVDSGVSSQTLSVLRTRAKGFGINLVIGNAAELAEDPTISSDLCGALVQYPDVDGSIRDFSEFAKTIHRNGALLSVGTDLLALTMLKPPGEWGADIVFGNSARFGVPSGYGGPHAAFFAVTDKLKRKMPGRLVGLSKDTSGKPAYRLALQSKPSRAGNGR